jgi:hypothetical protein
VLLLHMKIQRRSKRMDFKLWGASILAVFGILYIVGFCISILSSQLQCSKINWGTSAAQAGIWAAPASGIYALSTYFEAVRKPFSNTLMMFGLPQDKADIIGVGYLVMLMTWISTVWNIHNTEKVACNPDAREMTEFKQKLLAELQSKQEAEEKNAEVKSNGTNLASR